MNRTLQFLLFLLLFAAPSFAQTIPPWEVFGGYSYQRSNVREYYKSTPILFTQRNQGVNLQGWDFSFSENINPWFGGTLDVSGHYASPTVNNVENSDQMYTIMYGPRFSFRPKSGSSLTPFAHVLVGAAHMSIKVTPTGPKASDTSFALAPGGGIDYAYKKNTAIRLFQVDYLRANSIGANQSNLRISAGVILYLGGN